jgi:NitT/TauT family transport system substrate-binding protein
MKLLAFVRLAGCALALALTLPNAGTANAQAEQVIRLGVSSSDAFAEGFYAMQEGFFKKAGLNVELRPFRTGATIATGVAAGSIDIGISNVALLAKEISGGTPFVLIAGGGMYSTHDAISALCVAKSSTLRTPHDLEGKTIAIAAQGDQTQIGALAWLDANHVDASKVRFILLPFGDMAGAITAGFADAALITEPWLSEATHNENLRVFARPYDAVAPRFLIGVWFTTNQWHAKNPELTRRFVKAIYETARWANAHRQQTADVLATYSRIDIKTIRSMTRSEYSISLDPSLIQPQLDLAFKYHAIDRALSAADIIVK